MPTKIEALDTAYGDFNKKASEIYYIPSLQRPYTWDKKEIEKFWDDIVENQPAYYIGSIVAIAAEGSTGRDQIIDGQQRLTTIALMLIAIRDYIVEKKVRGFSDIEKDIDDMLIKYRRDDKQSRLSFFDEKANLVYEMLVNHHDTSICTTNTQKKFLKNLDFINTKLKEYSPSCKLSEVRELVSKIQKLQLIFIKCTDRSAAYNLFESINATGISLATTDLIKNSLFEALHGDQANLNYVETGWKKMFELFAEDSSYLKTYIRHHWISTVGYTSHAGLFDAFLEKYKNKELSYAKSLFGLASVYVAMRDASVEGLDELPSRRYELAEIKEVLTFLSFLGVDQVYSVLLFGYQNDIENFRKDLIRLTAFQFLYKYIPGSPSVPEKKYFANFCEGKISRADLFKGLLELCEKQGEQFVKNILEKVKFIEGKSGDIQFILEKYLYYKGGPGKFLKPTIEHVIPQDISDPIFKKFKCEKKDALRKIHELGNLTILEEEENTSKNKFNQIFSKKKSLYKKHVFPGNRDMLSYGFDIDPAAAIEQRGKAVVGDIYTIFLSALKSGRWDRQQI